eukprot:449527-Pleurochrysis_carterae.AAC.1
MCACVTVCAPKRVRDSVRVREVASCGLLHADAVVQFLQTVLSPRAYPVRRPSAVGVETNGERGCRACARAAPSRRHPAPALCASRKPG